MEELIFFAVIILFSILDAIAKKRRKAEGEEQVEDGDAERWEERYTPDASRSERDDGGVRGEPLPPYTGPYRGPEPGGPLSSEGMVPDDIWEEIAALARGQRPPGRPAEPEPWERPEPDSERLPSRIPTTSPIRRSQVGRREVGSRGAVGEHPVHRSHAEYGTDPSERTPVPPPRTPGPSREVREIRRALVEGGASEARKAVILHEVLGRPVAYREQGGGGGGT